MKEYKIVECGVNTNVYKSAAVNGTFIEGSEVIQSSGSVVENRLDYGIGLAAAEDRARVVYTNEVDSEALRTISLTKKLYREDGTTELEYSDDDTSFNFRLYLASEFDELDAAKMHTYHVKDPHGNYCRWDVLAGTKFKVVERSSEIPDGYSFQKYRYMRQDCMDNDSEDADSEETDNGNTGRFIPADTGVSGIVQAKEDPDIEVCNLRGWGLRVNKVWSDADYMMDRDAAYFAVFTRTEDADGKEELTLVPDSVRKMEYGTTTLYWYWLQLPVASVTDFDRYEVREVTLTEENPVVDDNGIVTNWKAVTVNPLKQNDTVTNNRPGIVLKKTMWDGVTPLAGAVFSLKDADGNGIDTFTSDTEGQITVAFLSDDKDYILTETKAPQGYHALESPMKIRLSNGTVKISNDVEEEDYILKQGDGETPVLTIKNRSVTFQALKKDGDTDEPLAGVHFALHRWATVDNVTSVDLNSMPGYEDLVTDSKGILPEINNMLPAGTYQLREKSTISGYQLLSSYIDFTVSETGAIHLDSSLEGVKIDKKLESGGIFYTLSIPNSQRRKIRFEKVDIANVETVLQGAEFDLYQVIGDNREDSPLIPGLISNQNGLLAKDDQTVFSLPMGVYHLVETKAFMIIGFVLTAFAGVLLWGRRKNLL